MRLLIFSVWAAALLISLLPVKTNIHFSFNNDIYIQIDCVAMDSPFGPVIAKIFMVELESVLVPKLNNHVKNYWQKLPWKQVQEEDFRGLIN